jgi:hypothetical protein
VINMIFDGNDLGARNAMFNNEPQGEGSQLYVIDVPQMEDFWPDGAKDFEQVFDLTNTQVETKHDYHGSGWGFLLVCKGKPTKLLYLPDNNQGCEDTGMPPIFPETITVNVRKGAEDSQLWLGMASCWQFCGVLNLIEDVKKKEE